MVLLGGLSDFWRDLVQARATDSFKELTTLEQIEWLIADKESDVWLRWSIRISRLTKFIGTGEEMIDVPLHDEREDTKWEEEIHRLLSYDK